MVDLQKVIRSQIFGIRCSKVRAPARRIIGHGKNCPDNFLFRNLSPNWVNPEGRPRKIKSGVEAFQVKYCTVPCKLQVVKIQEKNIDFHFKVKNDDFKAIPYFCGFRQNIQRFLASRSQKSSTPERHLITGNLRAFFCNFLS
jgi:hypothetical protein